MAVRQAARKSPTHLCYLLGPHFAAWQHSKKALRRLTPYEVAQRVAERMVELWGRECVVWDAFANVGSDAACLAQHFGTVHCSEADPELAELCRANLKQLGLGNVRLSEERRGAEPQSWAAGAARIDVAYLNPPWGPSYDRGDRDAFDLGELELGAHRFAELFEAARAHFRAVVVVCPTRSQAFAQRYPPRTQLVFTKLTFLFYD